MSKAHPQISIFLLRGLTREVRHWGNLIPKLEKVRRNLSVIPLEIPGNGKLRKLRSPLRIQEYTEATRSQFLSHNTTKSINIIIGFSFGGMIAANWLALYPNDFAAAVLINTSCSKSHFYKRCTVFGAFQLFKVITSRDSFKREKRIARLICHQVDIQKTAEQWAEIRKSAPVSALNAFRQLYAASMFTLPERVDTPTLLLCSKKDQLVSPQCSEDIGHHLKKRSITYHDHAGHDLTTDDPDWCISTLMNWLNEKIV